MREDGLRHTITVQRKELPGIQVETIICCCCCFFTKERFKQRKCLIDLVWFLRLFTLIKTQREENGEIEESELSETKEMTLKIGNETIEQERKKEIHRLKCGKKTN